MARSRRGQQVGRQAIWDMQGRTRAQSTPPMVRKAQTAAMARASLSGCEVAS